MLRPVNLVKIVPLHLQIGGAEDSVFRRLVACDIRTPVLLSNTMPQSWYLAILTFACLAATAHDLRSREIPDGISLALLVFALAAASLGWNGLTWMNLAIGFGVGLCVSATLFYLGGLGGGDVKMIAALGAALGWLGILQVLFWMALSGGALALVAAARGQKDFAYGPAILTGTFVYALWPHGLILMLVR